MPPDGSDFPSAPASRPTAVDLFCGAGGLSLGLRWAGFDVVAALDNDPIAVATYGNNVGDHVRCASITGMSAAELLGLSLSRPGRVTLLAGGPPCQGFSLQRRGNREDERNGLVLEFVRMVEEVRPEFFLMENVGGLMTRHGKPFLRELSLRVGRIGYVVHTEVLDAWKHGVPQQRSRAFLVGERADAFAPRFRFPVPDPPDRRRTVRDAIGDLPSPPADGSPHPLVPNHYREGRLSALNMERIRHVPEGGGRADLPERLRLACHVNNPEHRHLDTYGRLAWAAPSVTITARFDSFTRGRFGHPAEHRSLTIREGARLQTFPDDFVFEGSREEAARQVGNAVPPEFARRLGLAVLEAVAARR